MHFRTLKRKKQGWDSEHKLENEKFQAKKKLVSDRQTKHFLEWELKVHLYLLFY